MPGTLRVGIDIGGTFTDTVILGPDGGLSTIKVPSTPSDFVAGFMGGLERGVKSGSDISLLSHGTTVATNAAITRSGANTALVTTRGFRDTLLFRRTNREPQFDLWWKPSPPLINRKSIFEVTERLDYRGDVVVPLDEDQARAVARRIKRLEKEAVAVVLLHSFVNPIHEHRLKEIIVKECPETYVCISSDILSEIQEYERTATTTLNAYVGPIMRKYFEKLEKELEGFGYMGDVLISSSAGGVMTPSSAGAVPAKTMLSGPAAGVIAGRELAREAGLDHVITFDMGGTSLDIGLIEGGEIRRTNEWIGPYDTPVRFQAVDVTSIGAGGGSLAWVDEGGLLNSGPQSAGADPGPACYGRGGQRPTNTDAQVVLGRLNPQRFLGGEMGVSSELAKEAIFKEVCLPLGEESIIQGASDILTIATNNIVQALRLQTLYRGRDPRDFVLFAFGGAGPLFAASVAREADIPKVIVPPQPGLVSALGLLMMDIRHELSQSVLRPINELAPGDIDQLFKALESRIEERLAAEGTDDPLIIREVDVRYFGTSHTMTLHADPEKEALSNLVRRFEEFHEREYDYTVPRDVAPVELATVRVAGVGTLPKRRLSRGSEHTGIQERDLEPSTRPVYFGSDFVPTRIFDRRDLSPNTELDGPAVIEESDSTTIIEPGMRATIDPLLNIVIDTAEERPNHEVLGLARERMPARD